MERWRCKNNLSPHVLSSLMPRQLMRHEQLCSRWFGSWRAHIVFSDSCVVKMEEEEEEVKGEEERATAGEGSHLEADVLQVLGVLLDDLLNEVRVSGAQVRRGRLIELKLESPPQVRGVKHVIPAAAHGRGPGPVDEGQVLEDLQDDVVGQVTPVL